MALLNLKYSIEENSKSTLEPIISAASIIEFLKKTLDVTEFQIMSFFDREIVKNNLDVRAVAITDNNDHYFVDKNETIKVFNTFDEIHGFLFTSLLNIAYMSKVSIDDVYIIAQDLKNGLKELYGAIPESKIKYINKNKLFTFTEKANPTNQNLKKPEPQDQAELNRINTELEQAKATIQAKDEQIAELEKQLEQAKRTESAVDYQNYSIHGHTSDNFCLLFKISKLITEKCDPDNPHSYPNKEQFREYVKKYHSDSKELADAFYKIIIPEKVKNRGRTPQGAETFTGF